MNKFAQFFFGILLMMVGHLVALGNPPKIAYESCHHFPFRNSNCLVHSPVLLLFELYSNLNMFFYTFSSQINQVYAQASINYITGNFLFLHISSFIKIFWVGKPQKKINSTRKKTMCLLSTLMWNEELTRKIYKKNSSCSLSWWFGSIIIILIKSRSHVCFTQEESLKLKCINNKNTAIFYA